MGYYDRSLDTISFPDKITITLSGFSYTVMSFKRKDVCVVCFHDKINDLNNKSNVSTSGLLYHVNSLNLHFSDNN